MKFLALFYLILNSFVMAEEEFQPYMLEHKTKGCPENSYCRSELAVEQMKWKDAIFGLSKNKINELNKIKKQMGAPIDFYLASPAPEKEKHILWDSRCKNHKIANPKIYDARSFLKKFPVNNPTANAYFHYILIEMNQKLHRFTLSKKDFPLFFENGSIYLNREEDGVYYGVKIQSSGAYEILPPIQTKLVPNEIKCPNELVQKFKETLKNPYVYSSAICRKIWDRKKETFYLYITGDACF